MNLRSRVFWAKVFFWAFHGPLQVLRIPTSIKDKLDCDVPKAGSALVLYEVSDGTLAMLQPRLHYMSFCKTLLV